MTTASAAAPVPADRVPVLVAGGGPVGLTTALALARHGVPVMLIERNASTTTHPKMDITNGRSMELFRALGVTEALRAVAVPEDHGFDVSWVTKLSGWELARFGYPTVAQYREKIRACTDGTMTLEPPMRVSQVLLEPALKTILENTEGVDVHFGWGLESFRQDAEGVDAVLRCTATGATRSVRAQYLAGCDGAGSVARRGLRIGWDEFNLHRLAFRELGARRMIGGAVRAFLRDRQTPMDGRVYMVHFTSPRRELFERFGITWHTQSPEGWTLIAQNDVDTWTLHTPIGVGVDAEAIDPKQFLFDRLGATFDCDILVANAWQPRVCVAESYGRGRVWLAGDSTHQFVPTGGYGMNTGVGDAIGLAWALAANVQGWGGPKLLEAYEAERRAVGIRNRSAAARNTLVRLAIANAPQKNITSEGWSGDLARQQFGRYIIDLGNLENHADGIEFGYTYDNSPAICTEPGAAPAATMHAYIPTTRPGSRPPSVTLPDGQALFDLFGRGFTLLRFTDVDVTALVDAADQRGIPVTVVDVRDELARTLYERDLVLVRPDQHVAWRGDTPPAHPETVLDRVRGVRPGSRAALAEPARAAAR